MLVSGPMLLVKRSMVRSVFLAAAALALAMVAAAMACGLSEPMPTPKYLSMATDPSAFVSPSLDEQIFRSDTIVRASLLSAAAGVETVPSGPGVAPTYRPVQELSFRILEYLEGSGPGELAVVVGGDDTFLTEAEARQAADAALARRNTVWDDREAVLFLNLIDLAYAAGGESGARNSGSDPPTETTAFAFTLSNQGAQSGWEYSIDTLSRAWLPNESSSGTKSDGGRVGKASGTEMYITDGSGSPPPVVSLSDLRTRIAEIQAMLAAGQGVPGYEGCIYRQLTRERHYRNNPYVNPVMEATLPSGTAAGAELFRRTHLEDEYLGFWLSGSDADLFATPIDDDDSDPYTGFDFTLVTERPLPAGIYRVLYHMQPPSHFPCDFRPDDAYDDWTVTVMPPLDTLHEASFDPAADGAAVGYTAGAGRLEPAVFDVDGTSVEITDLRWEEGSVSLTVDPPGGLTDFALKFTALDGTTSRRLGGSVATEDAGSGTITWQVSVPIWEDGDLVLLRISEGAAGDPSPAPAVGPTATPRLPAPASASYPGPGAGNGSNTWHVLTGLSENDWKGIRSIYLR